MKQQRLFLLLIFFSVACNQSPSNTTISTDENNGKVVSDTIGNAAAEKILKGQLEDYLLAFNGGDSDKALYYLYSDVLVYMNQQYPNEYIDIQEAKDSMIIEMKNFKKFSKEKNIQYEFQIGDVTKKVNYKKSKICVVIYYLNTKMGLNKHSIGDEVIAISNDEGMNWKFFSNDPESAPGILRMKFPPDIVNKILAKD